MIKQEERPRTGAPGASPSRRPPLSPRLPALLLLAALCSVLAAAGCEQEQRHLKRPNLVRRSTDGRLFVSDFHHQRLVTFDAAGTFLGSFGSQGLGRDQLWQLRAMHLTGTSRLLVIDQQLIPGGGNAFRWQVKRFDDGRETASWPLVVPGRGPEELEPCSLIEVPDGYLVADDQLDAVLRFDRSFSYQGRWPRTGGEPFCSPTSLRQRDGEMWMVEQNCHRIRRLDPEGRELGRMGREGEGPGELRFPLALDVCPGQWVVVADLGNYRIQRFDLAGHPLDSFSPPPASPGLPVQLMDVLVSPDCDRLHVVDSRGNRVLVTTPTGQVLSTLTSW